MAKPSKKRRKVVMPEIPSMIVDEDTVTADANVHAQEFYEWKVYVVHLENDVERYAEAVENTLGPLRDNIREDLILRRGRTALTEKAVADALRSSPKARQMVKELRLRTKRLKLAKAVLAALDKKTDMIKSISWVVGRSHAAGL